MTVDANTSVLIADSHRLCRGGFASLILRELGTRQIQCADDCAGLVQALESNSSVGIVIIDSALPGLASLSDLRSFRMRWPNLRIVVSAWRQDRAEAFEALMAGAHGYVSKDLSEEEMAEALRTVAAGNISVPSIISEVVEMRTPVAPPAVSAVADGALTTRQREVLELLAAGLSNKEIARRLDIAEGTVKVHVTAAFRALHVHNRVGAAAALQRIREAGGAEIEAPPPRLDDLPLFPGAPR